MQTLNELLARVHYLNHPILSVVGGVSVFCIGFFVFFKNTKSPSYRAFFWWTICNGWWFICNGITMFFYRDIQLAVFWWRVAHTTVPPMSVAYYHFYLAQVGKINKKKNILYLFYGIAVLEIAYAWLFNDIKMGVYSFPNVGLVWRHYMRFSYFLVFGMAKYFIISLLTAIAFLGEYREESAALKKKQLKLLAIMFFVVIGGTTEWLVAFGIPLHIAWFFIPPFLVTFAYAIIRYKTLEIDTVIHRTIMWLATILLLIVPAGLLNAVLIKIFPALSLSILAVISTFYLFLFVTYYIRLRPRIDHFFRRRKYDYQTILGMVAERIATSISIEDLTNKFLTEVCEIIYLRNALLYILGKDAKHYNLTGRRGYKEKDGIKQPKELELVSEEAAGMALPPGQRQLDWSASKMCQWLAEHQEILEKEQVEVDPQYAQIKDEALAWFKEQDIEVAVPLVFESKVHGVICLGKKENLQAYTIKDLELLHKLGQEAGVTVFNALHYEDLKEKERMDEELRMGRQIQMTLLPQTTPLIPGLNVQGLMQPAREIGGDYYDFITLPDKDSLSVVIGDVSGKGVAAGLFMAMAKTAIHTISQEESSPMRILLRTNQILHKHISGQKFMTLLYLKWQAQSHTLTYSSAGHEHILVYRSPAHQLTRTPGQVFGEQGHSEQIEAIQSGGIMLGMLPDIDAYLEEKQINLEPGDKILLYTDGVTEALNQQGERFSLDRLKEAFQNHSQMPPEELMLAVKEDVYAYIGNYPQYDDITLVVMEAK